MSNQIYLIASRIKELREIWGYSQQEMAEKLNISLETYITYENAKMDFPVSVLYEIASILNVDLTELLTGTSPKLVDYCHVTKGNGLKVDRYEGYNFQSLAYNFVNRKIEPMIVSVDAEGDDYIPQLVTHEGQEFNYVLEGQVVVYLGNHRILLKEGDSLYFDPNILHGQKAAGGKPAKFLTVILL